MTTINATIEPRLGPQLASNLHWLAAQALPPLSFITRAVQFAMLASTERNGEFVDHLASERPGLGEPNVMWVRWSPITYQARLCRHKLIPDVPCLGNGGAFSIESAELPMEPPRLPRHRSVAR
jgi:hypothetical protein